jgi:hypothetical protein
MGDEMHNQPYRSYLSSIAGSFNFDDVLARHKALFGDARMEGEGGDGGDGGAPVASPADVPGAGPATPPANLGFPADTPVKDMSVAEQAAYWKHYARQHEERNKPFKDLTPEALQALREKADQHDALERELMSDKDKAIAEARDAAAAETTAKFAEKLVKAEFKSAAAGRLDADRLSAILAPLDLTKFLDKSGDVDEAKVTAYVDSIAPAKAPAQRGPSSSGLGAAPHTPGERGAQGRAMAEKRFGKAAAAS